MERLIAVARLADALAPGKLEALRVEYERAIPQPLELPIAYEITLQSYLFFGYAQTIEATKVLAQVRAAKQIPNPVTVAEIHDWQDWRRRGEILCATIYSPNFERLVANMASVSPELAEWMVVEGYGKVLSRPGPTALEREVASIAFLANSNHPVQLYSHVRGARNLGATAEQLAAVMAAAGLAEPQRRLIAGTVARVYGG